MTEEPSLGVAPQEGTGVLDDPNALVSVLITNYNYAPYVQAAVESVWNQSYQPLELVVVDDGSTDGSWELLQELLNLSPIPMNTIRGNHGGAVSAFNTGLAYCRGEFVSYLHADDVMQSQRVSKQVELLTESPASVLAHSEYVCVDQAGGTMGFGSASDLSPARGQALEDLLRLRSDVRSVTMTFRRSAVDPLDESLSSEDWQLILQLASKGEVRHSPEALVLRRIHGANASVLLQGNSDPNFRYEDIALSTLEEVTPASISLHEIVPKHVATVLRNAVLQGNFRKALDAYKKTVSRYPGAHSRWVLLRAGGRAILSRLWKKLLHRLPDSTADRLARRVRRWRRTVI